METLKKKKNRGSHLNPLKAEDRMAVTGLGKPGTKGGNSELILPVWFLRKGVKR